MYIRDKCYCSRCLKEIEPMSTCPHCGFDADAYKAPDRVLPLDSVLKDRYHVGCVIGTGGFGITYAGWDLSLDKPVAIKEFFPGGRVLRDSSNTFSVTPNGGEDNKLIYYKGVDWFQREARILAALKDTPNIVHVEDYFKENGTAYIIMDFISGKTLSSYAKEKGGSLAPNEVFSLMRKPIEALQRVHQFGLIHRDISPDNLVIDENGEVHIIDFGAATSIDQNSDLKATELFMNKAFAPPEQEYESDQGTWSDIYSICATMVRLIAGEDIPSPAKREQGDTLPFMLKNVGINGRQRVALIHGLNLKIRQRTENIAFLLNELYNVPLPKSELENKRKGQIIKRLVIALVASYVILFVGIVLKLDKQIPETFNIWINNDAEQAIKLADNYANGDYPGGSALANHWYHWAASHGTDEQVFQVASRYADSDAEYALELLEESGGRGYAESYEMLGIIYWNGEYGVERDMDKAVGYLDKAIRLGSADAMYGRGLMYIVEQGDFESALPLLSDAADAGNYDAVYCLASMYDNGDGVEKDSNKALAFMLKAAEAGQPHAMAAIGYFYICSDLTLDTGEKWRDIGTGLYWLDSADVAGSMYAKYYWGLIYKGDIDVSDSVDYDSFYRSDRDKAFSYMLEAAEAGYAPAMHEVSEMYKTGYGTEIDLDAAREWESKAKALGYTLSIR